MLKQYSRTFIIENMAAKAKKSKIFKSKSQQINELQAAIDYGIDITMLIDNINRDPSERIRRHQIALNTAEKLRKADHK